MRKKITITLWSGREQAGYTTDTEGLGVCNFGTTKLPWSVVHLDSGKFFGTYRTRNKASEAAAKCAELPIDWTAAEDEIRGQALVTWDQLRSILGVDGGVVKLDGANASDQGKST